MEFSQTATVLFTVEASIVIKHQGTQRMQKKKKWSSFGEVDFKQNEKRKRCPLISNLATRRSVV